MSPAIRIGATGFGLIAVCYGFARFAFGLFLTEIDGELHLGSSLSGLISGGSFAGYCIAIIASALLTERFGARAVAVGAALVAALGMAGIALAPTPLFLAIAVMLAGSSTGLASPPMAAAVAAAGRKSRQDVTNTFINAGTSVGVALSGPIALAIAGQWRLAFGAFAAVALVLAVAAMIALPDARGDRRARGFPRIGGTMAWLIAAYVMLTGVYLVWGTNALPKRPATGLMVGFLMIAVGQTAGAPVFGILLAGQGPGTAVACFAAVALLAGVFRSGAMTSVTSASPMSPITGCR